MTVEEITVCGTICNWFSDHFDFSIPMGWDELGVVITAVALLVAILGNYQTKQQFKKNMQEQEKAINVSLLDERIEILQYFEEDGPEKRDAWDKLDHKIDFMIERFKLLFSEKLVKEYSAIDLLKQESQKLFYEREQTKLLAKITADSGREDIKSDFIKLQKQFDILETVVTSGIADQNTWRELERLCKSGFYTNGEQFFRSYQRSEELINILKEKQQAFIQHLQEEIKESVRIQGYKK